MPKWKRKAPVSSKKLERKDERPRSKSLVSEYAERVTGHQDTFVTLLEKWPVLISSPSYVNGSNGSNGSNGTDAHTQATIDARLAAEAVMQAGITADTATGEGDAPPLDERTRDFLVFLSCVWDEGKRGEGKHGPLHSHHEALSVLVEEVVEYAIEVFKREKARDLDGMYHELVQIAAVAERAANLCLTHLRG